MARSFISFFSSCHSCLKICIQQQNAVVNFFWGGTTELLNDAVPYLFDF